MTPEQATALIIAITGLVAALSAVWAQLRQTHKLINSRMTELIDTTRLAAQLGGQLEGVANEQARLGATLSDEDRTEPPSPLLRPSTRRTGSPGQDAMRPGSLPDPPAAPPGPHTPHS